MGIILAVHWTTFFQSIQMSTVAIGLLTFSTFPVFTTFLEPYFFKEKINVKDIVIAHTLFINSLKNIKTQTAGIISSLEPVYGIILAVILLGELPTIKEVIGGVIILGTSFYSTISVKKANVKTSLNDNTGIVDLESIV